MGMTLVLQYYLTTLLELFPICGNFTYISVRFVYICSTFAYIVVVICICGSFVYICSLFFSWMECFKWYFTYLYLFLKTFVKYN